MDKKQFAEMLNGRQYGEEITKEEATQACENGLVVVFGYSDDCCYYKEKKDSAIKIYGECGEHGWEFQTEIPHETFEIFEDEELFCTGIVFSVNELV